MHAPCRGPSSSKRSATGHLQPSMGGKMEKMRSPSLLVPYRGGCTVAFTALHYALRSTHAKVHVYVPTAPLAGPVATRRRRSARRRLLATRRRVPAFRPPRRIALEPSYPVGYIGSLYLLTRGWPLSPPLLQTCVLQSSSLLPPVAALATAPS